YSAPACCSWYWPRRWSPPARSTGTRSVARLERELDAQSGGVGGFALQVAVEQGPRLQPAAVQRDLEPVAGGGRFKPRDRLRILGPMQQHGQAQQGRAAARCQQHAVGQGIEDRLRYPTP